tara:strand:+ start:732 stop:1064 length:333 start_codon:yes stop_codon:yes gene_type:complete
MEGKIERAAALVEEARVLLREAIRESRDAALEVKREGNAETSHQVIARLHDYAAVQGLDIGTATVLLAHRTGIDQKTLERWCTGESRPQTGNVDKLNQVLAESAVDPVTM